MKKVVLVLMVFVGLTKVANAKRFYFIIWKCWSEFAKQRRQQINNMEC